MRKLSPSESMKTEVHAPGFHAFAPQMLFHARCRAATAAALKRTLLTNQSTVHKVRCFGFQLLAFDCRVIIRNGDAQLLAVSLVVHLREVRCRLHFHIARVCALGEDLVSHLTGSLTQFVVVDRQGSYAAAVADALLACDNRNICRDNNVCNCLGAGSSGVIGRDIHNIACRSSLLRYGSNVVGVGERILGAGVTQLLKQRLDGIDLVLGVRLSRAVQQTYVLGIREQPDRRAVQGR